MVTYGKVNLKRYIMKRLIKTISIAVMAVALCVCAFAFAACDSTEKEAESKTYNGEYHYDNHGAEYGVKVAVTVKGDTIEKVEIVTSDYVEISPANAEYGWTEENIAVYTNGKSNLLKAYEGKKVSDVKAVTASIKGQNDAEENSVSDSALIITGATQCSARLLLAVQNALANV